MNTYKAIYDALRDATRIPRLRVSAPPIETQQQHSLRSRLARISVAAGALLFGAALAPNASADTLGVNPLIELPKSDLAGPGSFSYNAGTRVLSLVGQPFVTQLQPGLKAFWSGASSDKLTLTFTVGACSPSDAGAVTCEVGSGVNTFTVQGNIPGQYNGTLLTGQVTAFGFSDLTTSDVFDFRVMATGGLWVDDELIPSGEVGFAAGIEGSTFVGSFAQDFRSTTGRVKGSFGPLPDLTPPGGIAALGDRVFEDLNGNGVQDCPNVNGNNVVGDETVAELENAGLNPDDYPECFSGIGNVPVALYADDNGFCDTSTPITDDTGNALTAITNAQGFYGFDQLDAGDYCVVVTKPAGICDFGDAAFTGQDAGADNQLDSDVSADGVSEVITLTDGLQDNSLDAGVICPARIGDLLFEDTNQDGSQTDADGNDEPGVDGTLGTPDTTDDLTVELYACTADGERGTQVGTTTIDANGNYFFDVLPGSYEVVFTAPDGSTFTTSNVAAAGDGADSDANSSGATGCIIDVASNDEDLTIDAGIFYPQPDARFGNLLFHDKNRNGIQDGGEDGIDGTLYPATVTVYKNCDAATPEELFTYAIGGNGEYLTDDLFEGNYCAKFTLPAGFCGTDYGPAEFTLRNVDDGAAGADERDSDVDPTTGFTEGFFLPEDTTDLTWDAGVYCNARVGDRLWDDTDTIDGLQSTDTDAEPGVAGANVTLYECTDGVANTANGTTIQTDANGFYEFFTAPGSYAVGFEIPSSADFDNYIFTLANQGADDDFDSDADRNTGITACFTVASQESDLSLDAGIFEPNASLGDTCFHDLNANGIQDQDEPGIEGCTVELFENTGGGACEFAGDPLSELTTAGGMYMYKNVLGGDYCLKFTPPADFCASDFGPATFSPRDQGDDAADSDVNAAGETGNINLGFNEEDLTIDAGLYCAAGLGDRAFIDANKDGRQNCADSNTDGVIGGVDDTGAECAAGIGGLTVNLRELGSDGQCNADTENGANIGAIVGSQATDSNGFYRFQPLVPGDYCVEMVRLDDSYNCTDANIGTDSGDSDIVPAIYNDGASCITQQTISLESNSLDLTWDGGFWQPASLGDYVFEDTNEDGKQTNGEPGVDGVSVELLTCDAESVLDENGAAVTTVTSNGGQYLFDGLEPGCYKVRFNTSRQFTTSTSGTAKDADDSDADPATGITDAITLGSGENDPTWDAGLLPLPAAIGNEVFLDENGDGVRNDGEPGVPGAKLTISGPNGYSAELTTGNNGEYLFDNLAPGSYTLTCTPPTGYDYTTPFDQGSTTDKDSNANDATGAMGTHSLASGDTNLTIDCGLVELPASLGDFVWNDADRDGIQDADEEGIAGVTVDLYQVTDGTCDTSGTRFATQVTDGDGEYAFTDLVPGDYCVTFEQPAGLEVSPRQAGNAPSEDSDGLVSDVVNLEPGEFDDTIDAGFYEKGPDGGICIPSIDFDLQGLSAGDIVLDQFQGVTVSATDRNGNAKDAMIFDSANPTGGDTDLGSPNQQYGGPGIGSGGETNKRALGNVLIISEDGNSKDPDDDARGGEIVFEFDVPVQLSSVGILDIDYGEDGGFIEAFDANGAQVGLGWIEGLGNNSYQEVAIDAENVSKLVVHFPSSGSVASLAFCPDIDIRKQEEGPDSRNFQPGDQVTFEIVVTNTGEDPLTDVTVSDPLLPACDMVIDSLDSGASVDYRCTGTAGAGIASQTFADYFNVRSFGNNDGDSFFEGDWFEVDAANDGGVQQQDPHTGNVVIGSNNKVWLDDAPNTNTEPSIQRALNLAGATSATLDFTWTVHTGVDRDDAVTLDISKDGGSTWTVLKVFTGFTGAEINHRDQSESFDIGDYASADTVIRWRVTNLYGGSQETFKVDNVVVTVEGAGSGGYVNEACVSGIGGGIEVADCDTSEVVVDGFNPPQGTPGVDIRKEAEGPDERTFEAGDTVTFEIVVSNTGDEELTNVVVTDPLTPACDKTIASLPVGGEVSYTCETTLDSGAETRVFEDDLDPQGFDGNDGDTEYSTPWIEYDVANRNGVDQDPHSGRVVVGSNEKIWLNDYYDTGTDPSIQRTANLSGAESAVLTFDWITHNGVDANDEVVLELSADGGATWQTKKVFQGAQTSTKSESVDISAFISDETTLRFRVSQNYGGSSEMFKVDNVKIVAEGSAAEGFVNEACVTAQGSSGNVGDCDSSEVLVSDEPGEPGTDPQSCPTPMVDGLITDWSLDGADIFPMYKAGRSSKEQLATAYTRYADGQLYVLVLTEGNYRADKSADDAWVKIYDEGQSTLVDGDSASFAWVYDGGRLVGYEASFPIDAGSYDKAEIHLNVGGETASTGKKWKNPISLDLVDTCPIDGDDVTEIDVEAEDGETSWWGSKWSHKGHNKASSKSCVKSEDGYNSYDQPPSSSKDRMSWKVNVPKSGDYKLWGRVITPNSGSDSFWVRVNGGEWTKWNGIPKHTDWGWDDVHDSDDGNKAKVYRLDAGEHEIEVAYREDGCMLDKWRLTNDLSHQPAD